MCLVISTVPANLEAKEAIDPSFLFEITLPEGKKVKV